MNGFVDFFSKRVCLKSESLRGFLNGIDMLDAPESLFLTIIDASDRTIIL